uniref:DYW domain-containing protein n=1 Tax=Oryza barthii TaxID=65489 RepID=A0A0D3FX46_9ORYZ
MAAAAAGIGGGSPRPAPPTAPAKAPELCIPRGVVLCDVRHAGVPSSSRARARHLALIRRRSPRADATALPAHGTFTAHALRLFLLCPCSPLSARLYSILPRRRWSLGAGGRPPPVRGNARRHWPHSAQAQHTVACTSRAHLEDVRSGFRRGVQAYTTIKHGLMFDRLLAVEMSRHHLVQFDAMEDNGAVTYTQTDLCLEALTLFIEMQTTVLLLNPKEATLSKNLRVCFDCHSTTKLIAKVYNTEIVDLCVARIDFNHFKDGSCSCNEPMITDELLY